MRSLCEDKHGVALRHGVLWYQFDGRDNSSDGGHTQYILGTSSAELRLRECDRKLYENMRRLLVGTTRSVAAVDAVGALPAITLLFNRELNFDQMVSKDERCAKRRNWITAGLREVEEAEVVFADPDNGLEVPNTAAQGGTVMPSDMTRLDPIDVMYVREYEQPSEEAFAELEAAVGLKGRRFYGVFDEGAKKFWACVQRGEQDDPASLGLRMTTIEGGL